SSNKMSTSDGNSGNDFTSTMGARKVSRAPKSRVESNRQQSYSSYRSTVLSLPDGLGSSGIGQPASSSSGLGPAPRSVVEWNTEDVVKWLTRVVHMGQY
ncbi:hypothetical protein Pmar_PMAR003401, partial [Perkinsus marinus ATCC 50983]